ncbi:MAG: RNB domain-containing ribonuclease [Thermoanaerobaculia bacterium]
MNFRAASHRHDLAAIAHRVMRERGFAPDFEPDVLAEVDGLDPHAGGRDGGARDLTGLLWSSIDNDDSRDLDQVAAAERLPGGAIRLLVAIADVDALVHDGSATDGHARTNTTSIYTAGGVFPMLPERLSYDRTSLNEDGDRLAVVVEMVVEPSGAVSSSSVSRALVRNHARLTYDAVAAWLDGDGPVPERIRRTPGMQEQVRTQDEAAQALKAVRLAEGALVLQSNESRPVFDGEKLVDLAPQEPNRAKELIENLMVAANGATARFLEDKGLPSLRRVVREPARWARIVAVAAEYGEALPAEPDSGALARFLAKRRKADPLRFPDLSLVIVKLMGPGAYAVERPGEDAPGHFGLAVKDYTHSTAPNRRYPDLITQRLLKAAVAGSPSPYTADALDGLARHCTEKENDANKVERHLRKSAAALLLSTRVGDRFDGVVTGASEKGTWVRLFSPPVEGRVERGQAGLDVGDRVMVTLLGTDVERGFIDFARAR